MNYCYGTHSVANNDIDVINSNTIKEIMKEWKENAGILTEGIVSYRITDNDELYILTNQLEHMLGKRKYLLKGYTKIFEELGIISITIMASNEFTEV